MDPIKNPFSPGAGTPPPELAGRKPILDRAKVCLGRIMAGKSEKSFLLVGLRGVGKTVLLNEINKIAEEQGFKSILLEAHEDKRLPILLLPVLRQILYQLDRMEGLSEKVKRGFRVLRSFLNAVKVKYQDIEVGLDIDPETGTADSGDIESDLAALFEAVAEAASDRNTAIALIIDELQYLNELEMSALIMAVHRVSQKQLPFVLIGAGLPQLVALTGKSKSYAERLFDFPPIGALSRQDADEALLEPARARNANFEDAALKEVYEQTKGYPYFIQEWGYQAWNLSPTSNIDLLTVQKATQQAINRLDESFFRVRFDRLTPSEKRYLRALAQLGDGSQRSGDIAEELGVKGQTVAPTRNNLIKKGMIYSPSHGDTDFTVPLFASFMRRMIPVEKFETEKQSGPTT